VTKASKIVGRLSSEESGSRRELLYRAGIVFVGSTGALFLSKIAGGYREVFFLRQIGPGHLADAYAFSGTVISGIASTMSGAITTALAPRVRNPNAPHVAIRTVSAVAFLATLMAGIGFVFSGKLLLASVWLPMSILIPLFCWFGILNARLIGTSRVGISSAAIACQALTGAIFVSFANRSDVAILAISGQIVGALLMCIAAVLAARNVPSVAGSHGGPCVHRRSLLAYAFIGYLAYANPVSDRLVAATMAAGTVALLGAADAIQGAISSTVGASLSNIAYSLFLRERVSPQVARRASVLVAIPVAATLFLVSGEVVRFLYPHFTAHDAHELTILLEVFSLGIPLAIGSQIQLKWWYSKFATSNLAALAVGLAVLNLASDFLFSKLWGVEGIAFSTDLVLALQYVTLLRLDWVRKVRGPLFAKIKSGGGVLPEDVQSAEAALLVVDAPPNRPPLSAS
jgi:peptidoglycan biosynthesis protein MviN/MurJ (putative lipid II flippase)